MANKAAGCNAVIRIVLINDPARSMSYEVLLGFVSRDHFARFMEAQFSLARQLGCTRHETPEAYARAMSRRPTAQERERWGLAL